MYQAEHQGSEMNLPRLSNVDMSHGYGLQRYWYCRQQYLEWVHC